MRQHASAYVSIRQHTSACARLLCLEQRARPPLLTRLARLRRSRSPTQFTCFTSTKVQLPTLPAVPLSCAPLSSLEAPCLLADAVADLLRLRWPASQALATLAVCVLAFFCFFCGTCVAFLCAGASGASRPFFWSARRRARCRRERRWCAAALASPAASATDVPLRLC
jgi:hypothetical protein